MAKRRGKKKRRLALERRKRKPNITRESHAIGVGHGSSSTLSPSSLSAWPSLPP